MKTLLTATVAAACVGLIIFAGWSSIKRYSVNTYTSPALTTFSSKNEVFVFVGIATSVIKENRITTWLRASAGSLPVAERINEDLLVFHYGNGRLSKFKIESSGLGGSPFTFRSQVYWGRGRLRNDVGVHHWRWNGTGFVALDEREWSEIDRQIEKEFKLYSDMNAKEGWEEKTLILQGQKAKLRFIVEGKEFNLIVETEALSENRSRIVITLASSDGGPLSEVLLDHVEGYKDLSSRDYQRLKAEKGQ